MNESLLKALDYGVLGLCAVMVIFAAKALYNEQARPGGPNKSFLKYVSAFLGFCLLLAALNAYVQLNQQPYPTEEIESLKKKVAQLTNDLQEKQNIIAKMDDMLDSRESDIKTIKAAARPILNIREGLIDQLPTNISQKETLKECVKQLKQLLN